MVGEVQTIIENHNPAHPACGGHGFGLVVRQGWIKWGHVKRRFVWFRPFDIHKDDRKSFLEFVLNRDGAEERLSLVTGVDSCFTDYPVGVRSKTFNVLEVRSESKAENLAGSDDKRDYKIETLERKNKILKRFVEEVGKQDAEIAEIVKGLRMDTLKELKVEEFRSMAKSLQKQAQAQQQQAVPRG